MRVKPRGDIEKLPKWAQRYVKVLEQRVEDYEAKLAEGPENSNVFADPYADVPRPLGESPVIEFNVTNVTFPNGRPNWITVRYEDEHTLNINCSNTMVIHPRASNSIEVKVSQR
jgi:23S rRNA-/tRNA-specific pseudouridylate synthase